MAQLNDSIVRGILEGSGVTRWEVEQLCHRWLQTSTTTPQPGAEALRELVQAPLAEYHAMRDAVGGCTDGHCVVKKREGMHTNGGCKCWQAPMTAQRMMRAGRKLADELESLLARGG